MNCHICNREIYTEPVDEYKDDEGNIICVYCHHNEGGCVTINKLQKEKAELISFILDCYYSKDFQDKMGKQLIERNNTLKVKYIGMGLKQ